MKRIVLLLLAGAALWLSPSKVEAQGAAFHDSVLQTFAGVPSATVRVCTAVAAWSSGTAYVTGNQVLNAGQVWQAQANSTGVTPGSDSTKWAQANCSTLASIYQDAALTQALANPLQTDTTGNFTFYAATGSTFTVQIVSPRSYAYVLTSSNASGAALGTNNTFTAINQFNGPMLATDPYRDIRAYGGHCYNIDSTLTATTAFKNAAIASGVGQPDVRVPAGCEIRVADQIQLQGSDIPDGWKITAGPGASVCGTAAFATAGPIVLVNRSGHWTWDVSIVGTCSGDTQNISTGGLEWDNNGSTGGTSTAATIGGSSSITSGGVFSPPAPSEGSQELSLTADVGIHGTVSNLLPTVEQDATSPIVNGTTYTLTADVNRQSLGYSTLVLALYANGVLKNSTLYTPPDSISFHSVSVSWTATAGEAGQTLRAVIGNVPHHMPWSGPDTQNDNKSLIDNVRTTNFTLSQGNAGFETPAIAVDTLCLVGSTCPAGFGWTASFLSTPRDSSILAAEGYPTDGSETFTTGTVIVYHPFVPSSLVPWIPIRIGNCAGNPANCSVNLEQSTIEGVTLTAGGLPGTADILFDPALCCDGGWKIGGLGAKRVTLNNSADGIKGPVGGDIGFIYASQVAQASAYGPGHGVLAINNCPGGTLVLSTIEPEPGGPIFNQVSDPGSASCASIVWLNQLWSHQDVDASEGDVVLGSTTTLLILGGEAFANENAVVKEVADHAAGVYPDVVVMSVSNSSSFSFSQELLDHSVHGFDVNRNGIRFTATNALTNNNQGQNSPLLNFTGYYWNGSTGTNHDTTSFGQIVPNSGSGYFAINHTEGAGAGGVAFGPPIYGGLTINQITPLVFLGGVTPMGTTGSTSDTYHVLACGSGGCTPIETSTANSSTTTANATLSSTNFNRILWSGTIGAAYFKVYRTANGQAGLTTGFIGKVYATCPSFSFSTTACPNAEGSQQDTYFFNDTGINGDGASAPVTNTSGQVQANGGETVGASGSLINTILNGSATLTYTAIAAQTSQEQTITITGASTTNFGVFCSPRATLGNANISWSAWVSSSNTVSVRVTNPTAGSVTPSAVAWGCTVNQ